MVDKTAKSYYDSRVFVDDGCYIHHSCLDCPLPACVFDISIDDQKRKARLKTVRQLSQAGLSVLKIVSITGLKLYVVKNILACTDELEEEFTENKYLQRVSWP